MSFHEGLLGTITSSVGSWTGLLINLIISTLVGGLVFFIVVKLIASKLGDNVGLTRVFLAVFVINLISLPIIWGLTISAITVIPFVGIIFPLLPFLIWLLVVKVSFGDMAWSHVFIVTIIGYVLSIYVVPTLVWSIRGLLPL